MFVLPQIEPKPANPKSENIIESINPFSDNDSVMKLLYLDPPLGGEST